MQIPWDVAPSSSLPPYLSRFPSRVSRLLPEPVSLSCQPLFCLQFSSVQLLSCVQLFVTPLTTARQASLSITNCQSLPKPMSIESVMPSSHLILCRPLLLLPSIFPSIRVSSNKSALLIRWPKFWSFSFSISPSNEHPGLISFRMDQLNLLAVQGTLKSLLQHHSSKASILWCSAFFIVQLSHPYMTTGKTIALTRWAFVDKVMSLLNLNFFFSSLLCLGAFRILVPIPGMEPMPPALGALDHQESPYLNILVLAVYSAWNDLSPAIFRAPSLFHSHFFSQRCPLLRGVLRLSCLK